MKEKFENRVVFAQNLARIMERKGKTRMDLCHDLDLKYSTVSDWLKAKTYPRIEALQKLAVYFSVSKPVLTEQWNSQLSDRAEARAVRIPVFARVAAGIPIEAIEEIIDWEEIAPEMGSDGDYFALRISGDSMEPKISNGDVVIVRKQNSADSGDFVIAMIDKCDAVCKKFQRYDNGMVGLISLNPAYPPMIFADNSVSIIGKVKELRAKF